MYTYRWQETPSEEWKQLKAKSIREVSDKLRNAFANHPTTFRLQTTFYNDWVDCCRDFLNDLNGNEAKQVVGPDNRVYKSASIAAQAEGVNIKTIYQRINMGNKGWRYYGS